MIYTPHHIKGNAHALWYNRELNTISFLSRCPLPQLTYFLATPSQSTCDGPVMTLLFSPSTSSDQARWESPDMVRRKCNCPSPSSKSRNISWVSSGDSLLGSSEQLQGGGGVGGVAVCRRRILTMKNMQRIDLDEHIRSRINQSIATDCRMFRLHRLLSTAYKTE